MVCEETEKCFQKIEVDLDGNLPMDVGINKSIAMAVLSRMDLSKVFNNLSNHMLDTSPTDNHVYTLVKCVALCFCKIQLDHMAKTLSEQVCGKKVRKSLSRLVLFKNQ